MLKVLQNFPLFLAVILLALSCSHPPIIVKSEPVQRDVSSESTASDSLTQFDMPSRIKYPWPSNYEAADIDEMSEVVMKELKKDINFKEKKAPLGSVQWGGSKRLDYILTQRDIVGRFSRLTLGLHREKGKDALDVIVWTFINLGMDQGMRDFHEGQRIKKIKENISELEVLLRDQEQSISEIENLLKDLNSGLKGVSETPYVIIKEMLELPTQELEQINTRALAEMVEGYYVVTTTKQDTNVRQMLEQFFSRYYGLAKEQGMRLQLRDNRTIMGLEQRVIEKIHSVIEKNGSLSKNDVDFLKNTLGQLRERLN